MTDIRNVGQDVQAEILKTVRKGQETVVEAIKTVRTRTPALSDLNLPFASKLPKPEELAGNAYSFAMRLLAEQRKFAQDVLHSTGQLLPGNSGAGAKKTAASGQAGTTATSGTGAARKTGASKRSGTAKKTGSSGTSESAS